MRKYSAAIFLSTLIVIFVSCHIDESVGHCIRKARVVLDWIETSPVDNEGKPVTITILPSENNPEGQTFQSDIHGPEAEWNTGKHTVVAYETPENAYVDTYHQVVGVEASEEGTISKEPNFFSAGSTTVVIAPDSEPDIVLPLYKQVRELVIQLKFEGVGGVLVREVSGNLDGIAVERHINYGFKPADPAITRPPATKTGNINYVFEYIGEETEAFYFSDSKHLLGINGEGKQMLKLDIMFKDGDIHRLTEDITALMDGFHTGDLDTDGGDKPWYIRLTFSVDADLNIFITDWEDGDEFWVIAE